MSRYDTYAAEALAVLARMQELVCADGRNECSLGDLALALLLAGSPEVERVLKGGSLELDRDSLPEIPPRTARPGSKLKLTPELRALLDRAESLAGRGNPVRTSHFLAAGWPEIAREWVKYLRRNGEKLSPEDLRLPEPEKSGSEGAAAPAVAGRRLPGVFSNLGRELTAETRPFPVVGRDQELDDLIGILMKCFKPNALLVGEPGVGKTALVEGLAERIRLRQVPRPLQGCRIIELRFADLMAGASVFGELEKRIGELITAAEADPHIILFLDGMHDLVERRGASSLADLLKPALSRGRLRVIGACTFADYHRLQAQDPSLLSRFQTIRLEEPTPEGARAVLEGLRPKLEAHFQLAIPSSVLDLAVSLAAEYLTHRRFPDKVIDVVDRAATEAARRSAPEVAADDVRRVVAQLAGIEFVEDSAEFRRRLAELEQMLEAEIYGQQEAIAAVANVVRLCKRKLDVRTERPDGVFLFTGPTGVGKTALALALAKALTGREDRAIRIDMSEYAEQHRISALIGSPPGYVGYSDEPHLLAELRRSPSGVLVLDEFEKAHPAVHRLFLQVFDSGRLTSALGETFSLANITIICTSNVWASHADTGLGFLPGGRRRPSEIPWDLLKTYFPLELLNRFDEIIVFRPIPRETARCILEQRILAEARRRLERQTGAVLEAEPAALELILERGYSPELGVRHLHRAFQDLALRAIARALDREPAGRRLWLRRTSEGLEACWEK